MSKKYFLIGEYVTVSSEAWRKCQATTYREILTSNAELPSYGYVRNIYPKCSKPGMIRKLGIEFEKIQNPKSGDGLFWFDENLIDSAIVMAKEEDCGIRFGAVYLDEWSIPRQVQAIKKVIFSGPCTIVLWEDGTKTMVRCLEDDFYDPEKAVMMAYLKKHFGYSNTQMSKWLQKYTEGAEEVTTPKKSKDIYSPLYNAINAFRRLGLEEI